MIEHLNPGELQSSLEMDALLSNAQPLLDIPPDSTCDNLFDDQLPAVNFHYQPRASKLKGVWAIGGGKGGVGKSLIASSLAITLARQGYSVVGIDLDLGGANLHTTLGIQQPSRTLTDFIHRKVSRISDCIIATGIPNLYLISGAQDALGVTEITAAQKRDVIKNIHLIEMDYLIIDLGAGTSAHTIDFFNYSDLGLLVLLPEPTSIENGYRFLKNAYYRYLGHCTGLQAIRPLIAQAMNPNASHRIQSPTDLFKEAASMDPELTMHLKRHIQSFSPRLIINQARTQADIEIGQSIQTVCKKYFGFNLICLGYLEYDTAVWQAIRKKKPVMLEFSHSRIAASLEAFTKSILQYP